MLINLANNQNLADHVNNSKNRVGLMGLLFRFFISLLFISSATAQEQDADRVFRQFEDLEIVGGTFRSSKPGRIGLKKCKAACQAIQKCEAYTYQTDKKVCHLKRGQFQFKENSSSTSAILSSEQFPSLPPCSKAALQLAEEENTEQSYSRFLVKCRKGKRAEKATKALQSIFEKKEPPSSPATFVCDTVRIALAKISVPGESAAITKQFKSALNAYDGARKCGFMIANFLLKNKSVWRDLNGVDAKSVILLALNRSQDVLEDGGKGYSQLLEAKIRAGIMLSGDQRFADFKDEVEENLSTYADRSPRAKVTLVKELTRGILRFVSNPLEEPDYCSQANRTSIKLIVKIKDGLQGALDDACASKRDMLLVCRMDLVSGFGSRELESCTKALKKFQSKYAGAGSSRIALDIDGALQTRRAKLLQAKMRKNADDEKRRKAELIRRNNLIAQSSGLIRDDKKALVDRGAACEKLAEGGNGKLGALAQICINIKSAIAVEQLLRERIHPDDDIWSEPDFAEFLLPAFANNKPWKKFFSELNKCHSMKLDDRNTPNDIIESTDLDSVKALVAGRLKACVSWLKSLQKVQNNSGWVLPLVAFQADENLPPLNDDANYLFESYDFKFGRPNLNTDFITAAPNLSRAIAAESDLLRLILNHRLNQYRKYSKLLCTRKRAEAKQVIKSWENGSAKDYFAANVVGRLAPMLLPDAKKLLEKLGKSIPKCAKNKKLSKKKAEQTPPTQSPPVKASPSKPDICSDLTNKSMKIKVICKMLEDAINEGKTGN